jgi:hypothetical protein
MAVIDTDEFIVPLANTTTITEVSPANLNEDLFCTTCSFTVKFQVLDKYMNRLDEPKFYGIGIPTYRVLSDKAHVADPEQLVMSQYSRKRPISDMQKCIIRPNRSNYYAVHHIEQPENQPKMETDSRITIQHFYGREGRFDGPQSGTDVSSLLVGRFGSAVQAKVNQAKELGVPASCKLEDHYLSWSKCVRDNLAA